MRDTFPWIFFAYALIILSFFLPPSVDSQRCKDIAHVHSITSRKHWEDSNVTLLYGNNEDYRLVRRLGAGAFAEGYLGYNIPGNFPCVIKIYHREKLASRVLREILILQNLCGGPNIMKLYDVLVEKSEGKPAVVFEYVNGTDFEKFSKTVEEKDLRFYMKELLKALAFTHKNGIIHRDIKPSNVMFDTIKRESRLIDYSLARFHYDGENHTVAGSLNYKAPEILLYNRQYGPPADMWSFGCILASIIFQKEPFFHGHDVEGQLGEISKVLGSEDFVNYVTALNIPHNPNDAAFRDSNPKVDLNTLRNSVNVHLATDLAIDAISKLLIVNPADRMTANHALHHPYFDV